MENVAGSLADSHAEAQGLATAFHRFASEALPIAVQWQAIKVAFRGASVMFRDAQEAMHSRAAEIRRNWVEQEGAIRQAVKEQRISRQQGVEFFRELRTLKGLYNAKLDLANQVASSNKLAFKFLEMSVIQAGVLATEFYAMNNTLIAANSQIETRNKLMATGLMTSVKTGALFMDVLEAQRSLVEHGMEMADNYEDVLQTVVLLNKGIGMSTQTAAHLATVVQNQVNGSFERVADTIGNIVNQTSLAADEAGRMATELARIISMLKGPIGGKATEELTKAVAKYEDALKRVGGQAGGVTEFIKRLSGPEGFGLAGILGVANPEMLAAGEGIEAVMKNLGRLGDNLVGQSQGWQRRMGLDVMAKMLGVSAEQANDLYRATKRAQSGIQEEMGIRERYRQQTQNLAAGVQTLVGRFIALFESGLMPFIRMLSGLVRILNSAAEYLGQFDLLVKGIGIFVTVAVPFAVLALSHLTHALYRVALASVAARLGLDTRTATLGGVLRASGVGGTGGAALLTKSLRFATNPIVLAVMLVAAGIATVTYLLFKIKGIHEQAAAERKAASFKHAAGLLDLHESQRERLYFSMRTGHFDGIQKQIESTLTAYGGHLKERNIFPESQEFARLMKKKAEELVRDAKLAAVTGSQFSEVMTADNRKLFDAQLNVAETVRTSNEKVAEQYRKQGELDRQFRKAQKDDDEMKWYDWKNLSPFQWGFGSFGQFWNTLTK